MLEFPRWKYALVAAVTLLALVSRFVARASRNPSTMAPVTVAMPSSGANCGPMREVDMTFPLSAAGRDP